jgi:hypothetical protein
MVNSSESNFLISFPQLPQTKRSLTPEQTRAERSHSIYISKHHEKNVIEAPGSMSCHAASRSSSAARLHTP